ncbi:MAG: site-specific integrase [Ignavibacteriaceae bacterium]|nr:site-specific integrase [Ignavibacteriaceae bacterium]
MYLLKRNKIYHLFYKDEQGKSLSVSTKCCTKAEAKKFIIEFFNKPKDNGDTIQPISYSKYKDFYKEYASARFSNSYKIFVKIAFDQFEKVIDPQIELSKISCIDVERFIALKSKAVKERVINGYLITLQAAFERAIDFKMLNKNIFKTVKKLKPPKNPPLFFTKEEFEKLLSFEDDIKLQLIYRFGAYTGARMGEIRFLKWNSINFEKELITIQNHEEFTTKSKVSRDIPLHRSLKEDLLKMKGESGEYIFLYKIRYQYTKEFLSRNLKAAVIRAKLNEKYHFHTLRHTFASWLVQKGVSIYEVSKLLGHADIKTTEIYAHLKENNLRDSVDLL